MPCYFLAVGVSEMLGRGDKLDGMTTEVNGTEFR